MRKLLFRSRSGEGYPMVIAVTLCLLMLFMVIRLSAAPCQTHRG